MPARPDWYLNGATIMTTPTPRQLAVARSAGFRGIEARAERLLEDRDEVDKLSRLVRAGEVLSLNGILIGLDVDGAVSRDALVADLTPRLDICRRLGAKHLLAVPPRRAGLRDTEALPGIREGLALARDQAATVGVRIAFEFLGFADCPVATPRAAVAAVAELDDVDLVLDSCHWHTSGAESLDGFPVERLAVVHMNDAPPVAPRRVEDADRVLPGEGVIRLRDLTAALRNRGYAGPFSVETFNPRHWNEDPASVARRGWAALADVLKPS